MCELRDVCVFFFFQAEDGIRDWSVTGVQTCALPIWSGLSGRLLFGAIPAIPRRVTSKPFPARSQRITEDARLLTSSHPEPVSAILVLRGVGILSLHPTRRTRSYDRSTPDRKRVEAGNRGTRRPPLVYRSDREIRTTRNRHKRRCDMKALVYRGPGQKSWEDVPSPK